MAIRPEERNLTLTSGPTDTVTRAGRWQESPHPNGAPAYYLGRPASLRITAMRPPRGRSAPVRLIEAVTGG